ncbi:MAG: family 43 glycosylhydrolase [Verrucomicrobiota bacterium]
MQNIKETMTCVCAALRSWWNRQRRSLAPLHGVMVFAVGLLGGSVAPAAILTENGMPTVDPSRMINCNGTYYVYSTGQLGQYSADRIHWTNGASPFDYWPNPNGVPPSAYSVVSDAPVWAPDVIFYNNKYYLYYCVCSHTNTNSAIGLLTNPTLDPTAPNYHWTDVGVVVHHHDIADGRSAIDPCPFVDGNNNLWLSWGSGNGHAGTSTTPAIFLTRLDNTTGLASAADTTEYPIGLGSNIEAPYVHYHAGYYYLFSNVGMNTTYNIRVARSASFTGPYVNKAGTQNASEAFMAATVYKNSINGNERGPGHVGILSEGGIDRFTYHYINTSGNKVLGEETLVWGPDGWPIAGADLAPGTYKISSLNSGLAAAVYQAGTTAGTPLDQETYTGGNFQKWTVSYTTNGLAADGYYSLTSPGSGSVAELFQSSLNNGTLIDQGVWSNGNHQRWFIEQTSEGYYRMVSPVSQKVIEVPGFSTAPGTSLAQMDWNNSVNQQWMIGTTTGTPPATPTGLAATSGNGQVVMTWTTVTGATAYHVKRGTVSGGPATTSVGSPTATSFIDRSVTNGIIYYYTVAAVNASGISVQSAPAAAKPQVPPVVTETDSSLIGGSFAPLAANNLILSNSGASALSITAVSDGAGAASTLTDGNLRAPASSGPLGIESGSITYNLGSGPNGIGYTITGLRSLTAWGDSGRINPQYTISYSLDGVSFTSFATVNYTATAGANGTDVTLGVARLSNVQSVRFTFPNTQQNIWVAYAELAVFGQPTPIVTVSFSAPVGGASYLAPASVTAVANPVSSSGTVTQVDFYLGVQKVGTATGSPWNFTANNLLPGDYTLSAIATDSLGVMGISAAVNITVTAPTPVITETNLGFANGSFATLAANDLILGNAGDSAALSFFEASGGWTAAHLTDGDVKAPGSVGNGTGVYSIITGGTVTYQLGDGANGAGYTITGIRALTSWQGGGRVNPDFSASFSLDGVNFYPIATANFSALAGSQGADVALGVSGLSNVRSIRFTFPNTQQNGGVSYTELAVFGKSSGVAPTQIVLSSSANPTSPGASVTVTATVQASGVAAADATGNIVFQVDGAVVATSALANGSASYTTSGLTAGMHTLTAVYSGDADYTTSAASLTQGVYRPPVVTESDLGFTGGSFAPLAGNNLILGNPGTNIALNEYDTQNGWTAANLTDGDLKAPGSVGNGSGVYAIIGNNGTVTYPLGGGANGTGYTLTGIRALTSWQGGGRVNPYFTASFSLDGVTFFPIATVDFSAPAGSQGADVALGVSALNNVRSIRFTFPGPQQNSGVCYTELAVFGKSSGLTNLTPTQTALSASANPSTPGTSVTFTATVLDAGVAAASATGNVVFLIDGADVATNAIANGAVSYTTSTLAGGAHTITAVYSGDAGYDTSADSLTQSIYLPPSVTETDLSLTGGSFATQGPSNLILGNAGTSTLTTVTYTGTAANLTDGVLQAPGSPGTSSSIVMIQNGTVTYSLGNGSAGLGFTLTGIRSLTAWTNNTRINPKYSVSYSADGVTFMPLATVSYTAPTGAKGTDVALAASGATRVKYLQFTFPNTQQNSGVAYSELAVYGTSTPAPPLSLGAQPLPPDWTSVVLNLNGLVTGQSYTVQSSPSLAAGSWFDEVTFAATQATAAFTYPMGGNARYFYRLKY